MARHALGLGRLEEWRRAHGLPSLPSNIETGALYIADRPFRLAVAKLRRLVAITQAHRASGYEELAGFTRNMLIGSVLCLIRRTEGIAQNEKTPLLAQDVHSCLELRR